MGYYIAPCMSCDGWKTSFVVYEHDRHKKERCLLKTYIVIYIYIYIYDNDDNENGIYHVDRPRMLCQRHKWSMRLFAIGQPDIRMKATSVVLPSREMDTCSRARVDISSSSIIKIVSTCVCVCSVLCLVTLKIDRNRYADVVEALVAAVFIDANYHMPTIRDLFLGPLLALHQQEAVSFVENRRPYEPMIMMTHPASWSDRPGDESIIESWECWDDVDTSWTRQCLPFASRIECILLCFCRRPWRRLYSRTYVSMMRGWHLPCLVFIDTDVTKTPRRLQ